MEKLSEMNFVIPKEYSRVHLSSQSSEAATKRAGEMKLLQTALNILALTSDGKNERPKDECLKILDKIKLSSFMDSANMNLMTLPGKQIDRASCSQNQVHEQRERPKIEGNSTAGSEQVEDDDWQDLHEEIGWMRETLLEEIEDAYDHVCKLWPESPNLLVEKDKLVLKSALIFLTRISDYNIRWSKEDCFQFVKTVKSFVLRYRDIKYAEQSTNQLQRPNCQYQTPEEQLDLGIQVFHVNPSLSESSDFSSLKKWPRLANRHNLMYKEFLSLKEKYSRIVTFAFQMYCKLCFKNQQKYFRLVWEFAFCTAFLKLSRSELLLFFKEDFDYYAGKVRKLVTGVDSMESLNVNAGGAVAESPSASSSSKVVSERVDWQEYVKEQIELLRKVDLPDIDKFYHRVYELCTQGKGANAELEREKRCAEMLKNLLGLTISSHFTVSQKRFLTLVDFVKFYAIRSRNELGQLGRSGSWKRSLMSHQGGSRKVGKDEYLAAGWDEELLNRIESTREWVLEYGEALARRCIFRFQGPDNDAVEPRDRLSLETAFKLLTLSDEINPAASTEKGFEFLDKIRAYVLRYRKIMNARASSSSSN